MRGVLVFLFAVLAFAVPDLAVAADWPQFHFGAARDGFSAGESTISTSNASQLAVAWRTTISAAPVSPPVVAGGVVYVGSNDANLYALDSSNGNILWSGPTGASIPFSPAVADGRVYVGSDDSKVYAFPSACSTPCQPLWTFQTAGRISAPPAVSGGVVYVGAGNGAGADVWALDAATGALVWEASAPEGSTVLGLAVASGSVYVGAHPHGLYVYPAACSNPCFPSWSASGGSPPATAGGIVYDDAGSLNNAFFAYPQTCSASPCQPLWTYATNAGSSSAPAIAYDSVFLNQGDGTLSAFPATSCSTPCNPSWSLPLGGFVSTASVANGIVYVGTDTALRAFDASSGASLATFDTGGDAVLSPAIADGAVYVSLFGLSSGVGKVSAYALNPVDTTPPSISVPSDITTVAFDNSGATVSYSVSVTDNVDLSPSLSCEPPSESLFPIGVTTVDCTATDSSGNAAQTSFTVTVIAPWDLSLTLDNRDTVNVKTGVVTLSGTVKCNRSAQGLGVSGQLQQVVARRATLTGSFFTTVDCTAPSSRWSATVSADNGRFGPGKATATITAFGCELTCDSASLSQVVTLR